MKKKGFKLSTFEYGIIGVGIFSAFLIYNAMKGKSESSGGGSGDSTPIPPPEPTFPTIDLPYAGSYSSVNKWVEAWETYALGTCVTDCSWRYDILAQTQDKLSDSQVKQVSDGLQQKTGKNMYEQMSAMWWFGGPYSNNKATALYERVQSIL